MGHAGHAESGPGEIDHGAAAAQAAECGRWIVASEYRHCLLGMRLVAGVIAVGRRLGSLTRRGPSLRRRARRPVFVSVASRIQLRTRDRRYDDPPPGRETLFRRASNFYPSRTSSSSREKRCGVCVFQLSVTRAERRASPHGATRCRNKRHRWPLRDSLCDCRLGTPRGGLCQRHAADDGRLAIAGQAVHPRASISRSPLRFPKSGAGNRAQWDRRGRPHRAGRGPARCRGPRERRTSGRSARRIVGSACRSGVCGHIAALGPEDGPWQFPDSREPAASRAGAAPCPRTQGDPAYEFVKAHVDGRRMTK
jgi:hypothetical protein